MAEPDETYNPSKPKPVNIEDGVIMVNKKDNAADVVDALFAGNQVLITDLYSTGLKVLAELKNAIKAKQQDNNFKGQREFRDIFHQYSQQILLEVKDYKLVVKKSPEIGWLKILYRDVSSFFLKFTDVQGLNSSWQWHIKGVFIPILGRKIFPYYGTYFPTRFEHLSLFAKWLKMYDGKKSSAYDIGVGSGILTYKILMAGFQKVFATDNNVNAIIGIQQESKRRNLNDKIELRYGDLFGGFNEKAELVVFNPPWIPSKTDIKGLDNAVYYEEGLFSRFFEQAYERLEENGKIAILFSNIARITEMNATNPIEEELKHSKRYKLSFFKTSKVEQASQKTKRNQVWREEELTELWVLEKQ